MKKIAALAPIAILLGLPASSIAMEVELYGLIDTGFKYQNTDDFQTGKNASSFAMVSGERNGSRWGLRGNEALNDEITLGFQLESGYDSDTGAMKQNRLFGRQSVLTLDTKHYGIMKFGRTGSVNSPNGSFLSTAVIASPWGGGTAGGAHSAFFYTSWEDNVIEYKTPAFGGVALIGHYSFEQNGTESEKSSHNNRDAAVGVSFKTKSFEMRAAYERILTDTRLDFEDPETLTIAAQWLSGDWTVNLGAQYAKNVRQLGSGIVSQNVTLSKYAQSENLSAVTDLPNGLKGYGLVGGIQHQVGAFRLKAAAAMMNYKVDDTDARLGSWQTTWGVEYTLSKTTGLYAAYTYAKGTHEADNYQQNEAIFGLRHWF
ncbi:porin [Sutterella wadsworthensis]|uniref:porin n=1 Tax=Sutterella wadsworthensis TaxID=40545 RepID=UPI003A929B3B